MSRVPSTALLLVGAPLVWYLYFWIVYLGAEAGCATALTGAEASGDVWVLTGTIAMTIVAVATLGYLTYQAATQVGIAESESHYKALYLVGVLQGLFFIAATLFVGIPTLFLDVC